MSGLVMIPGYIFFGYWVSSQDMTFLPGFPSETLLKTPYLIMGQLEKVKNYQQNQ
jgi:hypothetical protein